MIPYLIPVRYNHKYELYVLVPRALFTAEQACRKRFLFLKKSDLLQSQAVYVHKYVFYMLISWKHQMDVKHEDIKIVG